MAIFTSIIRVFVEKITRIYRFWIILIQVCSKITSISSYKFFGNVFLLKLKLTLFYFFLKKLFGFFKSCSLEYYELEFVQYESFNIVSVVFFIVNERLSLTRLHQSYHFLQSFAFDVIFCVTPDNSYNIIRSYVYLEEKKVYHKYWTKLCVDLNYKLFKPYLC